MNQQFEMENVSPINYNERIQFECTYCGACCLHVKESVPLESLDAYRLARYLRDQGEKIEFIDDVLARYADPVLLDECGYVTYMLKTSGVDDACIFLKDNRCTVQDAKPRACRTYPLIAEPVSSGGFHYHLSTEQPQHCKGHPFKARDWMKRYFSREDQVFVSFDFNVTVPIANLLRKIPESGRKAALFSFLRYRYTDFDLDKPFQEQFEQNNELLLKELQALAAKHEA